MPVQEEDFKRGGVEKVGRKRKRERDLFQVGDGEGSGIKKKKKIISKAERLAKRRAKLKAEKKRELIFKPNVDKASLFTSKVIAQDMLVSGIIKEIHDYDMDVSLPNGITGVLPITNISSRYTELLHKLTGDEEQVLDEEICSLSELFRVGRLVRCKIVESSSGKSGKWKPKLTINPKEVNQNLTASNLKANVTLCGTVASVEDRGYVIDLGIKGVKAFLTEKDSEPYIKDGYAAKLRVGSYVHCMVKSGKQLERSVGENRSINVIINPHQILRQQVEESSGITVQSVQPGMMFQVTVTKVGEEGLTVKFLSYTGTIHKTHLERHPDKFEQNEKLKATVMFIQPTTKIVGMSALPHLLTPDIMSKRPFGDLSVGTIVDEATVLKVDNKRGVFFKLGGKVKGFAFKKQLSDLEIKDIPEEFKKKSVHKCRVLDMDYMDNVAVVTLKESILSKPFLKYSDIEPGMVIEGTVKNVLNRGVSVYFGKHLQGFIPDIHLADIPLKHPEKFYEPGGKVRCKVITVDAGTKRLILTAKKSLINTKLPTVTSYNDCQRGMLLEGFIAAIKDTGVLVVFYNDVKGWVPKPELSAEDIEFPQKVFYKGQVVKCQVLTTHPEQEKMVLSLKLSGKTPFGAPTKELPADFEIGKIFNGKIVQKTDSGLDVKTAKSDTQVFIPKMHLSDHHNNWNLLLEAYKEKQNIKNAVYLSASGNVITASRRPSLCRHAKSNGFITDFSELKPGLLLPGSIRKVMDYGVFVDLGGGLVGLAPNKYLCDRRLADPRSAFVQGQAVVAKVTEVDHDRKRFLVSLRMTDCYHGDTEIGITLLEDYLIEYSMIQETYENRKGLKVKLSKHKVGELVQATIEQVNDNGVICQLADGVKGIATEEHLEGASCEVGKNLAGVILHVDLSAMCLEISFDTKLVKAVKNFQDNKFSKAQEEQVIKSEVQLIKEEFVLVSLRAHCAGRLAYLPAKRHLNDLLERHQYIIGQVNNVVIKRSDPSRILASLQLHENVSEISKKDEARKQSGQQHHVIYKPGAIVRDAVVTAVHEFQLNVSLNGTPGRVHVTEIADNPEEGKNLLKGFHVDQKLKVKVIGSRELDAKRSRRSLKDKEGSLKRYLPECTLKESMVDSEGIYEGEELDDRKFEVGDEVCLFVHNFHGQYIQGYVSPTLSARVHVLNCSRDETVIRKPETKFHKSCGYKGYIIVVHGGFVEVSFLGRKSKIEDGGIVQGYVVSKNPGLGVKVKLWNGQFGHVSLCDISDEYTDRPTENYTEGQCVQCYILQQGDTIKKGSLSFRKSRLTNSKAGIKDRELESKKALKQGQVLRGYVSNTSKQGIFVSLSRDVIGRVMFEKASEYIIRDPKEVFYPGKLVTVKVLSISKNTGLIDLSMLEKDTKITANIPEKFKVEKRQRKNSDSRENKKVKKRKLKENVKDDTTTDVPIKKKRAVTEKSEEQDIKDIMEREDSDDEDEVKVIDTSSTDAVPRLSLGSEFCWDEDFKLPTESDKHGASDSDSGDDSDEETKKAKPKRTRQEKKLMQQEEEKRLLEREKLLLDSERTPEAAVDFDRLVLQSPNSSIVWMRYMAFYLETAEVEKAKTVAERALKTISFREEQEKLNVWVAYLNLENMYGTHESLTEVFERAIKHNDPLKIHQQLITIYIHSGKIEAAEQLHNTVVKRFSQDKDVWINFGQFYFHNNKVDQARKLMQKSLRSLDRKHHVEVLSKFAQLEYKMGEPERGKTMFENILSSYPKRTDLWSIYIDMTIKQADISDVRQLFERVIHMNFSAKKMKFFFKKYLDFEEKYGSEEDVSAVKQKAVEYVHAKSESV